MPSGVEVERFALDLHARAAERRRLGLAAGEIVLAIVGALEERKGHALLLEALAQLLDLPLRVLCAGSGSAGPALAARRDALGLTERVRFLGRVDDIPALLAAVDVVVMPSRHEGLGVAALEAMAAGRPVIARRVGGLSEAVGEARGARAERRRAGAGDRDPSSRARPGGRTCPRRGRPPARGGALHACRHGAGHARDLPQPRAVRRRRRMTASDARLGRLVRRFAGTRVLVIGDLMLDEFVWGDVSRISPEAPVPIVRVRRRESRPGGAGNVVSNLVALGGRADACGFVGRDAAGRALLVGLADAGGGLAGVIASASLATTSKTRVMAHQQQVVRFDHDADHRAAPPRLLRRLRAWIEAHARRYAVIVVSDYGKGVVTPELLATLAGLRARHGFAYVIDPKRPNFPHYRGASLVKPNVLEASVAAGLEISDRPTLVEAGRILLDRWQADSILISRGEEGMTLFKAGARAHHFATVAQEVYDVTGAGDTVLATCALALAAGGTFEEAAILANHAAGVVVGKIGTATVSARELQRALSDRP